MGPSFHRLIYVVRSYSWLLDPRRFWRLPEYPIDRPIFLLGTQGGGLTLLSRMLRRHPDVVCAAGNSSYWTSADEIQNVYGPILPAELTGLRYKAPPHALLPPPRSWTYAARDLYPLYRKKAEDATPELRNALCNVIRLSALRHARDKGRFRFLDKSQTFTVRMGLIHELLRDSRPRFIVVLREPYVSVYRAATGRAADIKRLQHNLDFEERVDICAEHYANSMRAVFEDAETLNLDIHILRFEALLAQPAPLLRQVCDFAELDFRTDMLPTATHRLPWGSRYLDRWYPIRSDVNTPFESKLDSLTVERVNRHFGPLIERLGYTRRHHSM